MFPSILFRFFRRPAERPAGELSPLRAQILACFCAPEPTTSFDLRDRSLQVGAAARFFCSLSDGDWTAEDWARYEAKYREVSEECERAYFEGVLNKPHPDLMDHHKPPRDVYCLTDVGAMQALAVLAAAKAAAR